MSILAHRLGRGNIVWACWQPGLAGVEIGDRMRVNSGAMFIMMTPAGAKIIMRQIHDDENSKKGPMRPWHYDLALKGFLCDPQINEYARACYIFPPVGNYTQHTSGCDPNFSTGSGRPNCWGEDWCCPGTTVQEDPQRRPKIFMTWDGDHGHRELGSAVVDEEVAGHLEWHSWWAGAGPAPTYRPDEERRPVKKKNRCRSTRRG